MSALSDALELLEFADGPQRRRLEGELAEIEDRLERGTHADERATVARRAAPVVSPSAPRTATTSRASERATSCSRRSAARRRWPKPRIELASVRAGDSKVDVDAVVETLQSSIRRVRDVQDELRRLGY